MKKVLFIVFIALFYTGCSEINEDVETTASNEIGYLSFSNKEEAEKKLDEILTLKEYYNKIATEAFFEDKKIEKTNNTPRINPLKIDSVVVKESVIKYHEGLLKNVYSMRNKIGFTSIQSISDEINSLELIDPAKASVLFNKNQQYLKRSVFGVHTVFEEPVSELINLRGELKIDEDFVDLKQFIETDNKYQDAFTQYNLKKSNASPPRSISRILGYRYNYFLAFYDAGRARNRSNWWYRYDYYSRISTWVRVGNRFYRYSVSSYSLNSSSNYTEFRRPSRSLWIRPNVPSSGSNNHYFIGRNSRSSGSFRVRRVSISEGTFNFHINGWSYTFVVPTNSYYASF
ncbi:hypothetical protein [Polaribacter butkevichii]|uniref:Uncharacterized protein n=1 Tax=Polaribacter butkevichii TaxID=218490 RepID=A0A2P6C8F6_9FLAO|nr:hypothetical protein [Polaribacter butkevichii]PQJ69190.1 hypothetical protein BTO14_14285 [Polaribacter butkevichii]